MRGLLLFERHGDAAAQRLIGGYTRLITDISTAAGTPLVDRALSLISQTC